MRSRKAGSASIRHQKSCKSDRKLPGQDSSRQQQRFRRLRCFSKSESRRTSRNDRSKRESCRASDGPAASASRETRRSDREYRFDCCFSADSLHGDLRSDESFSAKLGTRARRRAERERCHCFNGLPWPDKNTFLQTRRFQRTGRFQKSRTECRRGCRSLPARRSQTEKTRCARSFKQDSRRSDSPASETFHGANRRAHFAKIPAAKLKTYESTRKRERNKRIERNLSP